MIEREKKLLLTKSEYDCLMAHYDDSNASVQKQIVKQINYYFDTDELSMNKKGITCRIRLKNGEYKGIMKKHAPNSECSTETEIDVYDGINKNAFTDIGLKLRGELLTERYVILKDTFCEAVLDKNEYLNHIDFELELEYNPLFEDYANQIWNTIIKRLENATPRNENESPADTQCKSKSRRFFEIYSSTERREETA